MSVDRGFTWMDDETLALIEIFSKEDIQYELNCLKRNIGVYGRIASELAEVGYRRTAYQCREKIKRLRKEYHSSKHCIENNITPKKPMKYFDLVDKIFDRDSSSQINNVDLNPLSSDHEEELHLTFNHEQESDASNSCATIEFAASQLPGTSRSTKATGDTDSAILCKNKQKDASTENRNDCENVSVLNSAHLYDLSDKDSPLDENESPWVPNVVLIENDSESIGLDNNIEESKDNNAVFSEEDQLQDFHDVSQSETIFKDSEEPPKKKRKTGSSKQWLKKMLDDVTETFLNYQGTSESRFIERITHFEQERIKRDESMQKLWLEFEERRRKDEQEHELKMLSLFGQFVKQINNPEVKDST
ncbi:Myb/SANT-like DNA-binding domain-containing [Argiope bruennichi]|uniref:Myb/SANT-like DNA-binding domain-containing n=1 Tax=Argiope bruennichi TaxID=94029 RepID=A0A8T0FRI0_ARGBR|nr:Myb/SANT-like DNA-binding domain-containing [Argiope bruennichi]